MDFRIPNNKSRTKANKLVYAPKSMRLMVPNSSAIDKPPNPGSLNNLAYSKNIFNIV